MFDNILVPLDGSDTAEIVLPMVQELSTKLGSTIILVRVVDVNAITRSVVPAGPDDATLSEQVQEIITDTVTSELKEAEEYLATVEANLKKAGATVTTEVLQGVAGPEVLKAIEADHVDVAAIATHGRSGIGRTIFGSVAD